MNAIHPFGLALAGVAAVLFGIAAVTDVAHRRIPNWTIAALLPVAGIWLLVVPGAPVWWSSITAALIVFAATYGLFLAGWLGAGDSKLVTVAALFAGLGNLPSLALLTVLVGGALALGMLLARPRQALRGMTSRGRAEGTGRGVPYGVAIALGAIITLAFMLRLLPGASPAPA